MDQIVSARVAAQGWYKRHQRIVPLGIFLLAMAITLLAALAIERTEATRQAEEMRAAGRGVAAALERRAASHTAYLRAGAALLASRGNLTEETFYDFLHDVRDDEDAHNSEGVSWAPWLPAGAIAGFVKRTRAQRQSDFTIHSASLGPQAGASPNTPAVPVLWRSSPNASNQGAVGYDLYSEPVRRDAINRALRQHRPTLSGRTMLHLWSGQPQGPGFVMFAPVFAHDPQRTPLGFIVKTFTANGFLSSGVALGQAQGFGPNPFAMSLYDGPVRRDRLLAHLTPAEAPPASLWASHLRKLLGVGRVVAVPVTLARRPMVLVVDAGTQAPLSNLSMAVLGFGTILALLMMLMARMIAHQAAEDRASLGWLREQTSIRASLTRELNHRVKNTLANVLSIIALTRHRAQSLEDFAETLTGRIRALSATHDLLTSSDWGPTRIEALIAAELAPYAQGHESAVDLEGPAVDLAPNDALLLGLAIHELATNASKYGALSVLGGRVSVHWQKMTPELVRVHWKEVGGPPVSQERRRGFGTELLERIVAHELGHAVEMDFATTGLACVLVVPVRVPAAFRIRA